jgi:hypothetical protein
VSKIEILDCEQKSPEWYAARAGLPTASMFATIMAQGKSGSESIGRNSYMRKLAGEIITGIPMESYSNDDMERGIAMEPELRSRYAFMHDADIVRVGFIKNGLKGCSPDGLIGDDGMVEFKSAAPHVMIEILMAGEVPTKHKPQCQGNLWVAERVWIDLVIGSSPKLPLFVSRINRDEPHIRKISGAVADFNIELRQMVEKIRSLS